MPLQSVISHERIRPHLRMTHEAQAVFIACYTSRYPYTRMDTYVHVMMCDVYADLHVRVYADLHVRNTGCVSWLSM